jgi:endonuclease/exonuclease/phosphatase family metal-dependent hydrolase
MQQLTIVTMNCLGLAIPVPGLRRRMQALGKALAATNADIVCLQEVGRWRHLIHLRMDETTWPYAVAIDYPYAPKGGLVTLSRHTIAEPVFTTYRERGRPIGLHTPERFQGKGVLQTPLRAGAQPVVALNTHLAANYNARWTHANSYAKVERAQLRELAAVVRAIPEETLVIVAGDFNVPRGSWLYREFVSSTGVHDPLAGSDEPTYRPLPGLPARAAQALDHILIRAPRDLLIEARSELCFAEPALLAHGTFGYLSDHLGVRTTLRWSQAPGGAGAAESSTGTQWSQVQAPDLVEEPQTSP